jgi:hypothetical protein
MFHLEVRRVVKEVPTSGAQEIHGDQHVERAPPPYAGLVHERIADYGSESIRQDDPQVAETVGENAVLHGHELSYSEAEGELGRSPKPDQRLACDEGGYVWSYGADDAPEQGEGASGNEEPAATEDIWCWSDPAPRPLDGSLHFSSTSKQ